MLYVCGIGRNFLYIIETALFCISLFFSYILKTRKLLLGLNKAFFPPKKSRYALGADRPPPPQLPGDKYRKFGSKGSPRLKYWGIFLGWRHVQRYCTLFLVRVLIRFSVNFVYVCAGA